MNYRRLAAQLYNDRPSRLSRPLHHVAASLQLSLGWVLIVTLLSACAIPRPAPEPLAATPLETLCRVLFDELDLITDQYGVNDAQATRIAGFPYLRANRHLASYRGDTMDETRFNTWVNHLRTLDREGRRYELSNLAPQLRATLPGAAGFDETANLDATLGECGDMLRNSELDSPLRRDQLLRQINVPDDYSTGRRVAGLYPLTALAVRASIKHWHARMQHAFTHHAERNEKPLAERVEEPTRAPSSLTHYGPAATTRSLSAAETARLLNARRDALDLPQLSVAERQSLFTTHAPIVSVRTARNEDRIGAPYWSNDTTPRIDITRPTLYTQLSHTRFQGRTLLQLNYLLWFPERRKSSWWDILGGHLDGLIWRVTLGPDGTPWLYDTIHPCGCYHTFFPSSALRAKKQQGLYVEPILIAHQAPPLKEGQRAEVHVAAHTHYVLGLTNTTGHGTTIPYELRDHDELRSLPQPEGERRSLFDRRGFVSGTQRGERWLLWPMGIVNPGAMRQWGRHATAFIGRRHFDDAYLLENLFDAAGSGDLDQESLTAADTSGTGTKR